MFENKLIEIMKDAPPAEGLWEDGYKIPWHEPGFSRRMLREHLSQEHDLASRRQEVITGQAAWIAERFLGQGKCRILDLGCGPGLYAPHLTQAGHAYYGIDFSPASIEHARHNFAGKGQCEFVLGDVCRADYGQDYDLAMMLFGEINVFSPDECTRILAKAHEALTPSGRLFLEAHTPEAVRELGCGSSWYKSSGGLFSEQPHVCLTENHWYQDQAVALQIFHVVDLASGKMQTYRSTNQAYNQQEYQRLLNQAGFKQVEFHLDWPAHNKALLAVSGIK
ncbi:MAG: class I SAM-dependent methyltransferase [Desulfarculaceae bacterium]|jgi:SAM-dependent methyltransferase